MKNEELAQKIIDLSGGKENIDKAIHCITRLRFNLKDESKADSKAIEELDGVLGTRYQNGQFQVIIGNNVKYVYAEVAKILGLENDDIEQDKEEKIVKKEKKDKQNVLNKILDVIASSFQPILPAIIGAGMMKGILAILMVSGLVSSNSGTYQILNIVADSAFYFLPFLLAVSVSRKFDVNEYLGIVLAGALMYPTIIDVAKSGAAKPIYFLSIPIHVVNYSASVFPIILGIIIMAYIYKAIDRLIPKPLKLVLTPTITLLITIPLVLAFVAPIGDFLGKYLAIGVNWLFENAGLLAGLLLGLFNPFIIMTGMHYSLFPIIIQNFGNLGYDSGYMVVNLMTNVAQAGAVLAVALRTRNKELKSVSISSGISALIGITEPAMFGVNIKLRKPLYAAMISGGITSAGVVALGLKNYGFVLPGLLALPTYISPEGGFGNLMLAILGVICSFIIAFVLTLVMGFEDEEKK
ncbi:MAG TPA: PTS beta-glucoside transporter subunit EIIBCA [Clostridiaceae bacterium]|jgi:PTS system beta-glucosides-specific IIC component|nr:PTS beta-glucoside transporter subunit EIIBCA [Clostridiaceae bacterium]